MHNRKQLREALNKDVADFARLLQVSLIENFDSTLRFIKTQKLLTKRRSSAWISNLWSIMEPWISQAPLKGKRKAQLKRHFEVSNTMQRLLEEIDAESAALKIWQGSTAQLLKMLFSTVDRIRFEELEKGLVNSKSSGPNGFSSTKSTELARRELRGRCDYIGRVVNQVPRFGFRQSSNVTLADSDIEEALALAAVADVALHIFDCYSYKNFQVSIEGKNIKLHTLRSTTLEAEEWSTLRLTQQSALNMHGLLMEVRKARSLLPDLRGETGTFAEFIQTDNGVKLWKATFEARKYIIRRLKRDVEELIELDLHIETEAGRFAVKDLLDCWAVLDQIALCDFLWRESHKKADATLLSREHMASLIASGMSCELSQAQNLLAQFILNPNVANQDPFLRPLIQLSDQDCLLASTFIETSRFGRNLFTIAIREGKVNFSEKGLKPLRRLCKPFEDAGYKVVVNLPVSTEGQLITDVDIAATKDNFLFIGQTKVLIHPDTPYEDWKVLESLQKAAGQLRLCLDNKLTLLNYFGFTEGQVSIVPFLLTNIWDFTGSSVDGFKIVDFSYLVNLLRGGEVWQVQMDPEPTRKIRKFIKGKHPTGEELANLITNPIHQKLFMAPSLNYEQIRVGEWTLTVPVNFVDEDSEKVRETKMQKLAGF